MNAIIIQQYCSKIHLSRRTANNRSAGISVADDSVKTTKKSRPICSDIRTSPSKIIIDNMYAIITATINLKSSGDLTNALMDSSVVFGVRRDS